MSNCLLIWGCQPFTNSSVGLQLDLQNVRSTKWSVWKTIWHSEQFFQCNMTWSRGNACDLNLSLKSHSDENFLNVLLYGSEEFNCNMNKEILKAEIKFLKSSERFNDPPFIILKIFLVLTVLTFRICFSFVLILDIYAELTLSGTWLSVSYLSCVVLF